MGVSLMSAKRVCRSLLLGCVVAVSVAGLALASNPTKGATYKGSWGPKSFNATVQFKVSGNGKRVSGFNVPIGPLGCQGSGPKIKSGGSAGVKKGRFRLSLFMYFPPTQPSRHVGSLVVTGTFARHGKESGKLSAKFSGQNGYRPSCDKSVSYSTKG
jgi:hypothetical protein